MSGTTGSASKVVEFDTRIYKKKSIDSAIKEYKGIAKLEKSEEGNKTIVTISDIPDDLAENIEYEFRNYVLWKIKN